MLYALERYEERWQSNLFTLIIKTLWCTGNHSHIMEFFYNFESKQVVNPLDKITHFFINPYQLGGWKTLGLGDKVKECDVVIQESTGLPIIILPISVLELNEVHVKMEKNGNMTVTKKTNNRSGVKNLYITTTLYIKPTEQSHIVRVDTVLCNSNRDFRLEELLEAI